MLKAGPGLVTDVRRPSATALVLVLAALLLAAPLVEALATSLKATRVLPDGTTPGATTLGVTGAGVTVAVLDTGVDDGHASLFGSFVAGADVSNGVSVNPLVTNPADTDGHGTHVANILLGRGGGGASRGVAPGARLVDVKVSSDVASISVGGLALGLRWVLDYNAGDPPYPVQVVSLSLATFTPGDPEDEVAGLIEDLATSGVTVVAAAGNCGPGATVTCRGEADTITSPGTAPAAITVAALDDHRTVSRADDTAAGFSSRGPGPAVAGGRKPDVAAPGQYIISADTGGGTANLSGTSQAAPHVSGIVALMLEAKPGLTPGQVKEGLTATASHPTNWDAATGYGAVDAYEAVRHAKGPPYNVAPVASIAPSATTVPVGTRVVFSGNASRDPDGLTLAYRWSLAGRDDATTSWVAYTLDQAGEAAVKLVVTDADGAATEAVAKVTVQAPPPPDEEPPPEEDDTPPPEDEENETTPDTIPPAAAFTVTPPTPLVGEGVTFDGGGSADDTGVATYAWDFTGDGVPEASGRSVQRVFSQPGVVLVTLEVADAAGNKATAEKAVVVSARPEEQETPDAAPPTVVIARPQPGARVASPVRAEWTAADDVGVAQTTLVVDGEKLLVAPLDAKDLDLAPGAHTIRVEAKDALGKEGAAQVVFIVIDPDAANETAPPDDGDAPPTQGTPGPGLVAVVVAVAVALARRRGR